tara:strand:+ start:72 stop:2489 length:2418 start_codon:yes stop_codon:yes gene_type:complete
MLGLSLLSLGLKEERDAALGPTDLEVKQTETVAYGWLTSGQCTDVEHRFFIDTEAECRAALTSMGFDGYDSDFLVQARQDWPVGCWKYAGASQNGVPARFNTLTDMSVTDACQTVDTCLCKTVTATADASSPPPSPPPPPPPDVDGYVAIGGTSQSCGTTWMYARGPNSDTLAQCKARCDADVTCTHFGYWFDNGCATYAGACVLTTSHTAGRVLSQVYEKSALPPPSPPPSAPPAGPISGEQALDIESACTLVTGVEWHPTRVEWQGRLRLGNDQTASWDCDLGGVSIQGILLEYYPDEYAGRDQSDYMKVSVDGEDIGWPMYNSVEGTERILFSTPASGKFGVTAISSNSEEGQHMQIRVIKLLVSAVPSPPPTPPSSLSCSLSEYTCLSDRSQYGLDIYTTTEPDTTSCAQRCCENAACIGFDWDSGTHDCWLSQTPVADAPLVTHVGRTSCELSLIPGPTPPPTLSPPPPSGPYVAPNGEELCQGHGYAKEQCAAVGCCQFAECPSGDGSGECHSNVGDGECVETPFDSHFEDLPTCTPVPSPISVHGDPMFKHNGTGTHFWIKEDVLTPLLLWRTADGLVMELSARTFNRPETGNQWIKQVVVAQNGTTVLDVSATTDDRQMRVKRPARAGKDVNIQVGEDNLVDIEANGVRFVVKPAQATKFYGHDTRHKYEHLDMQFPDGISAAAKPTGIFAQLAGVQPMLAATKELLVEPRLEVKQRKRMDERISRLAERESQLKKQLRRVAAKNPKAAKNTKPAKALNERQLQRLANSELKPGKKPHVMGRPAKQMRTLHTSRDVW